MRKILTRDRKIVVLYILICFTMLLLTTTTYAWFTTTKIVSLETFSIHIASDSGLQISSDGTTWKAILELEDLYDAEDSYGLSIDQFPAYMEPVSTAGLIENGRLLMFDGNAINSNNSFILVSSRLSEEEMLDDSSAKFIAFDIFLKTESPKSLYLSSNSGVNNIGINPTGIENSFRVAFLNQGNVSDGTDVYRIQSLSGATDAYIWEPNYDTHTLMASQNAASLFGMNLSLENERAIPYYGVVNEIRESDNVLIENIYSNLYSDFLRPVEIDLSTRKSFNTNQYMFELRPGITKFRIYIWIEGQDVDCEDNASLGDINVNLQITTVQ